MQDGISAVSNLKATQSPRFLFKTGLSPKQKVRETPDLSVGVTTSRKFQPTWYTEYLLLVNWLFR